MTKPINKGTFLFRIGDSVRTQVGARWFRGVIIDEFTKGAYKVMLQGEFYRGSSQFPVYRSAQYLWLDKSEHLKRYFNG